MNTAEVGDRCIHARIASLRISALAVPSLQQVGRCLPHLHEPENQGEYDDDAAELTDPRTPFPGRVLVHGTSSWALSVRRGRVLHHHHHERSRNEGWTSPGI